MDATGQLIFDGAVLRNIGAVLVIVVVEIAWLALLVFLAGALIFG
jgi:hypothetical protein